MDASRSACLLLAFFGFSLVSPLIHAQPPPPSASFDLQTLQIDPAEAMKKLAEEIERCENVDNEEKNHDRAHCLMLESTQYLQLGAKETALERLGKSLELLKDLEDLLGQSMVHQSIAQIHAAFADTEQAQKHYDLALNVLDELETSKAPLVFDLMKLQGKMMGMPEAYVTQLEALGDFARPILIGVLRQQVRTLADSLPEDPGAKEHEQKKSKDPEKEQQKPEQKEEESRDEGSDQKTPQSRPPLFSPSSLPTSPTALKNVIDPETALARIADEVRRCEAVAKDALTTERANCLLLESLQYLKTRSRKPAMDRIEESLEILEHLEDHLGQALVHQYAAQIMLGFGSVAQAKVHLDKGLAALDTLEGSTAPIRFDVMKLQGKMFGLPDAHMNQLDQLTAFENLARPFVVGTARPHLEALYEQAKTSPELEARASRTTVLDPALSPISEKFLMEGVEKNAESRIEDRRRALEIGDSLAAWDADFQLSSLAISAGNFEEAARILERSVRLADELPLNHVGRDMRSVAACIQLGITYGSLAQPGKAEKSLEGCLERAEASGVVDLVLMAKMAISSFRVAHDEDPKHLKDIQDLLDQFMSLPGRQSTLQSQQFLDLFLIATEEATGSFPDSDTASQENHLGPSLKAMQLLSQGKRAYIAGRFDEALKLFEEGRITFEELGLRHFEIGALMLKVGSHSKLFEESDFKEKPHFNAALTLSLQAVEKYDHLLEYMKVDELLAPFMGQQVAIYTTALALLTVVGRFDEAFEVAERARARGFLHLLGNKKPKRVQGLEDVLIHDLEKSKKELARLEQQPLSDDGGDRAKLGRQIEEARRRHEDLLTSIKLANPEYASFTRTDPISVDTLRNEILDEETVLIAYFTFDEAVLVWIIDREKNTMRKIDLLEAGVDLGKQVTLLSDLIRGRDSESVAKLAEELHRWLILPLLPEIQHQRWILVPHGILHALPFAALRHPETKRFLAEDYTLSYAPSATILKFLRDKVTPINGKTLIFGNPTTDLDTLPAAEKEAGTVARLFDGEALIGDAATESYLRSNGAEFDLLHFAAHGVYQPRTPRFSHIALANDDVQDGQLEVHEIFDDLDLSEANLVVLSACQTALGERTRGDDLIGLTRAFLYAGSPTVISTLWKIDDDVSARLIKTFYCRWLEGATVDHALRAAQIDVMSRPESEAPYFWAAFKVSGHADNRWHADRAAVGAERSRLCAAQP